MKQGAVLLLFLYHMHWGSFVCSCMWLIGMQQPHLGTCRHVCLSMCWRGSLRCWLHVRFRRFYSITRHPHTMCHAPLPLTPVQPVAHMTFLVVAGRADSGHCVTA